MKNKECGFLILILCVPRHIQKGSSVSDLAASQFSPRVIPDLFLVPDAFSVRWISTELISAVLLACRKSLTDKSNDKMEVVISASTDGIP